MTKTLAAYLVRVGGLILLLLTLGAASAQPNSFAAVGSGAKSAAVTAASATKRAAIVPATWLPKAVNAF